MPAWVQTIVTFVWARSPLITQAEEGPADMTDVLAQAQAYVRDLPVLEDRFRTAGANLQQRLDKLPALANTSGATADRSRRSTMASSAMSNLESQHYRIASQENSFRERLHNLMDRATKLDQACAAKSKKSAEEIGTCTAVASDLSTLKAIADTALNALARVDEAFKSGYPEVEKIVAANPAPPSIKVDGTF